MYYIFGDITEKTAEDVIAELHSNRLRKIMLHTSGGDLMAALAIYDAIVGKGITVIGTGLVASAGIAIYLGGDERLATKHTRFMTHSPGITMEEGEEPPEEEVDELVCCKKIVADIMTERAGVAPVTAEELMSSTHYFDIDQAIRMGVTHREW